MPFKIYRLLSYWKNNKTVLQADSIFFFFFFLAKNRVSTKYLQSSNFLCNESILHFLPVTLVWTRSNIRLILVFFLSLFFHDPFTWKPINIIFCKHSTTWQTITPNRPQSILQGSSYKKSLNSEWSLLHLRINQKDNIFLGSKTAPSISNLSIRKMTN